MYSGGAVISAVEHNFIGSYRIRFNKLFWWGVNKSTGHKFVPHGSGGRKTGALTCHRCIIVVAGPYTSNQRWRITNQPAVAVFLCGTGFGSNWPIGKIKRTIISKYRATGIIIRKNIAYQSGNLRF